MRNSHGEGEKESNGTNSRGREGGREGEGEGGGEQFKL